ncbi:MAG: TrkH family potassium uptake protein [bacterium]
MIKKIILSVKKSFLKLTPGAIFVFSYILVISIGTILLKLPLAAHHGNIHLIDALFTATSAVCVTGLSVVDTGSCFSIFGQLVILALIQTGGIGIITFGVFLTVSAGWRMGYRRRSIIQESYSTGGFQDVRSLVGLIFKFVAVSELIGTIFLMASWYRDFSLLKNFYYSFFHSIAAFCNAGFALFNDSFISFHDNIILNLTITFLIILGGLGFPVIYELWTLFFAQDRARISLHTKLVLLTSLVLILMGMGLFWAVERNNSLAGMTPGHQIMVAYFQSVTARTAGFATVNFNILSNATLLVIIILMFIGASPGSCGGGIKTTSMAALMIVLWNKLLGQERFHVFKRSLSQEAVSRTIAIFLISIGAIILVFSLLLIIELGDIPYKESRGLFLEYLFETVSAFGTVGLSLGTSQQMGTAGKLLIILMMFIGRVGILTMAYLLTHISTAGDFQYAEENVIIG